MSNRRFVEVPEELNGKVLEARISAITHSYQYIDVFLDIFLPEDSGTVSSRKRLWSRVPKNSKADFSKQNEAAMRLWRNILGIPDSVNNSQLVEDIELLAMLDIFDYRLSVSMEPGEEGRRYLKVVSYDVAPIDGEAMRKMFRELLLKIRSLNRELDTCKSIPPLGSKERPRRATAGEAPAVYPWAKPWGSESVEDYV